MDEHQLNDLLECSVCLDRLDTSSRVLPCQHTFCRKCLEVIVSSRQELRCPECRILVDIKIDELPPNVLLMRILEGMKNAAAAKTQLQHHNDSNKLEEAQKLNQEQQQQIKLKQQHQQQQQQHKKLLQYQQQQRHQHQLELAAVQQHKQQQLAAINTLFATNAPAATAQRRLPHAYALYDFESAEPSDLRFKKGDLVLLRRKIDNNWYVGQLNGVEGTFPINYVQIIVPLPTPTAVALYDFKMGANEEEGCLTFKKGTPINVLRRVDHNWAEGRIGNNIGIFPIAFVELNALAKQLLDSFLRQNSATASAAAAGPTTQQTQTHPHHPPPYATHTPAIAAAATFSSTQSQPPRSLPPIPLIDPTTNLNPSDSNTSSSNSSPHTTSPNSTTATCSSSIGSDISCNSIPSSPNQSQTNSPEHVSATATTATGNDNADVVASSSTASSTPATAATTSSSVRFRDSREKRHSLNALLSACSGSSAPAPALSILQSNRHSAEILSMPSELSPQLQQTRQSRSGVDTATIATAVVSSATAAAAPQSTVAREQQQTQMPPPAARINVLKSCGPQNVPPPLPWGYLALYPYKPRKADELELKKGCVYIVGERCLDGWFKGKNWQDNTGVFPGNYVTPLRQRDHQQLMHQWKFVPPQQQQQQPQQSIFSTTAAAKNQNHMENINTRLVGGGGNAASSTMVVPGLSHQPPDLPPRQLSSVWTKPLGHTVEAFFNRCSNKTPPTTAAPAAAQNEAKDSKEKDPTASNFPPATAGPSTSSASTAVNLMKRLTHIKSRSKSPGSAIVAAANNSNSAATPQPQPQHSSTSAHAALNNYSMDNPTFENAPHFGSNASGSNASTSSSATHAQMHPVHVRSGSCPSQLLQSLPIEFQNFHIEQVIINPPHQQQQQQQVSPQATYGSQRVKGSKERPQLQNVRQTMDGTFRSGIYNNTPSPPTLQPLAQQQQQIPIANILLTKGGQQQNQQQQQPRVQTFIYMHRKSQSLDANTLTAAPPPPLPQLLPTTTTATATATATTTAAAATHIAAPAASTNTTTGPCNISAAAIAASATTKSTQNTRESRFRCIVPYPPNSEIELELQVGDLIYVHRKQKNGWYKGTHARTNKTGLFPASFVEPDI